MFLPGLTHINLSKMQQRSIEFFEEKHDNNKADKFCRIAWMSSVNKAFL